MDCQHAREALSARLDGEPNDLSSADIDAHVAGCVACTRWAEQLGDLHRLVRVRAAEPVPDLSATIMERAGLPAATPGRW